MKQFTVKPMSNIAQVGLDELEGTACIIDEESNSFLYKKTATKVKK